MSAAHPRAFDAGFPAGICSACLAEREVLADGARELLWVAFCSHSGLGGMLVVQHRPPQWIMSGPWCDAHRFFETVSLVLERSLARVDADRVIATWKAWARETVRR